MRAFLVASALAVTTPVLAQTPWVHVAIDETGTDEDPTRVNVNLPFTVVQLALEAAPESFLSDGELHFDQVDHDVDVESLRKMWAELRDTGDSELVTVVKTEQTVRLRREGGRVLIDIDDSDDGDDGAAPTHVNVEIPVRVIDALFSGEGDTLDVKNALAELSRERGDIVKVDDGGTKIYIWIDERD